MRSEHEIRKEYHRLIEDAGEFSVNAEFETDEYNAIMLANQAHMCRMLASKLWWVLDGIQSED